ncbi:peptide chain release factor N(5)-glutamine methyltransferase [Billgrantia kenyensis]|uniref:Release factor glutamine methyltransferase n=1 Tax=Billgrantia kenyensis TaxID=321266 RepID=A0A7V9W0K6_9GAMM|nr:peptide chain release factor N(5)-glutamine methyltransferase [Halomonas kenyensis]MBA2778837.1 peptide chain release factor N(5)-glutamine methyltransferase [Halomonas kenyensis]MCG6661899.1 peptide chain release factor N(5)-glutamine methyltransferase [Halomonas kenyensis]
MRLDALLARAAMRLAGSGSPSPRLDAEVLLCHVLDVDRTWLYTWSDHQVDTFRRARFEALVAARAVGHPVAYLTGQREFWGLALATSPHTLIPRPDTETLVEVLLELAGAVPGRLLDLGTGTGAVALAFASERPDWEVLGVDRVPEATALAESNARRLGMANARFLRSDWFSALGRERFTLIASNPPYIEPGDPHLMQGDVRFEPTSALVSAEKGLADLRHLARGGMVHLEPGGWLVMEHGHDQAEAVRQLLEECGYVEVGGRCDLGGRGRVTFGRWCCQR